MRVVVLTGAGISAENPTQTQSLDQIAASSMAWTASEEDASTGGRIGGASVTSTLAG